MVKSLSFTLVLSWLSLFFVFAGGRTDWKRDGLKGMVRSVTAYRFVKQDDSDKL
jgi:hypothetical protein